VSAARGKFATCLVARLRIDDGSGFISEGLEKGVILSGEAITDGGGDEVCRGEGRYIVEHGVGVALCSN
jgi:hypothetical protein